MEWLRRMFGYSDNRSHKDNIILGNPTWEEIFESRNFNDKSQRPDGHFKDFHMGGSYSYSMGDYEDSFSSLFGQMDDMFQQLDSIMQGFHGHPENHLTITEGPDFEDPCDAVSPRDSLLKKPDREIPEQRLSPQHRMPHHHSPFRGPIMFDSEQGGDDFDENGQSGIVHGGFDDFHKFGMTDPFQMMEEFFKSFGGGGFGMVPFGEHPGGPMLPKAGTEPEESPRDAIVKKEDSDLDDRITGGFSELLKDMPKYDPPIIPGQSNISQPEVVQPQPRIQRRYHSTSIVRIRQPDGSFEETRKYTDSSGREEVTVTRTQPEDGNTPGSLLHQDDQGILDGHSKHDHFLPSMFSWFFTR